MTTFHYGRLACDLVIADTTRVTLSGRLDDTASLADLIAQIPATGDVVIHTAGITFVNSIGMREWIRVVRALKGRGQRPALVAVADVLITQMNFIPEFRGATRILSFHAQYVCPACGDEATPVVDAIVHAAELTQMKLPLLPCAVCGAACELGDFPQKYASIFE